MNLPNATVEPIELGRIRLLSMSVPMLEALIAGDGTRLHALTGAVFPEPVEPPPLMADALPVFLDALLEHSEHDGWWSWLAIDRDSGRAVGSVGLAGPPDDDGVVLLGYAIYPEFAGRGFATEAVSALLSRLFRPTPGGPAVRAVRATIPADHPASIRVAEKCGFVQTGTAQDDDIGTVLVYEARAT